MRLRPILGLWAAAAAVSTLAACAARTSPQTVAELASAHDLISQGCYSCLQEALATYERLAALPQPPLGARRGAFDAAILLTLRARELGLADDEPLARARQLAPLAAADASPASSGSTNASPTALLDALPLVVGEQTGRTPEERDRRSGERREMLPPGGGAADARRALGSPTTAGLVAAYVSLAIDCEDASARKTLDRADILARHPVPLMRFRVAMCGLAPSEFAELRAADPRWVESAFFEGRLEMTKRPEPDIGKAAEHFAAAHEALPDSPAMTMALANARNALTEYEPALALFDRVVAVHPTHREAHLGRVLSLSYLARYYDAIAAATRLIDLGTYYLGDAYYWRAWNRYQVHQLDRAWDDVERATKLMVNTSVYTLAGFIAYARLELDTAIDRLQRAFKMDNTNCEAAWTEGLVHVDKSAWTEGGSRFAVATACFASAADEARRDRARLENSEMAEPLKSRRIATAQKRIDTSLHRRAQSAFNAASCYVRLGQRGEALTYVDVAAEHPMLKDKAASLRAAIEKLPR